MRKMSTFVLIVVLLLAAKKADALCVVYTPMGPIQVAEQYNPTISDIAFANLAQSPFPPFMVYPVIYYNPNLIANIPPSGFAFAQMHECAHHVLRHLVTPLPNPSYKLIQEQAADCWAINTLVQQGVVNSCGEYQSIQNFLAHLGPGDWSHFPGPQRSFNLGFV